MVEVIDLEGLQQAINGISRQISTAINIEKERLAREAADTDLSAKINQKLSLTGGTMTGAIRFNYGTLALKTVANVIGLYASGSNMNLIRVGIKHNTTTNGQPILITGNEEMVIGGGEAPVNIFNYWASKNTYPDPEGMFCVADRSVYVISNMNSTTYTDSYISQFDQSGNLKLAGSLYGNQNTRSDVRDKTDILDIEYPYQEFISKLRPVTFVYDMRDDYVDRLLLEKVEGVSHDGSKKRTRRHNGFIAQEVKKLADELGFDFAGYKDEKVNDGDDYQSLDYVEFIPPMVAYIQDLRKEVDSLKKLIEELQSR